MKNISIICRCVFFVLFSVFHVLQAHSAEPPASNPSAAKVKADSQRLKAKIQRITNSVKLKESQRSKLQKKIYSFDQKIQKLGQQYQAILVKQDKIQARINRFSEERRSLLADLAAVERTMSRLLQAFYILRANNSLKTWLTPGNRVSPHRVKIYFDYLVKDYNQQYQTLTTKYTAFAEVDQKLDQEQKALEKQLEKNRRQLAVLEENYAKRSASLSRLEKEIKTGQSRITLLKNDQKRLGKLAKAISELDQRKSTGISFAKQKGGLTWPVKGRLVNKFGRTRQGTRLKWRGVLIETRAGASVNAVAAGRVVFADWLSGYGFVLIIEHGRGYMSLYAHNQQLLANVGDRVRENQSIARAGNSGRRGKPALYFEIRYKGKPVNPEKWILARKSS